MNEITFKVKQAMLAMQRRPWEQGIAAQALLELGDLEMMVLLAKDSAYLQAEDGRLAMLTGTPMITDPAVNGVAVLKAAQITGEPYLQMAAKRMADYLLHTAPRTSDGTLCHIMGGAQVWIDSLYMAPPFLVAAGYPEEAVRQIEGIKRCLWHPKEKLFSHIWDHNLKTFVRPDFWGVGNGWAVAGLTSVINALPDTMAEKRELLIEIMKEALDGCLAYQRDDGLFHNIVDHPDTFVEVNLAQMLTYSIYRGIRAGWLSTRYKSYADCMRIAIHSHVDDYGFVHDVCGAPNFDRAGVAAEGQAFFLMMEAAYSELIVS